MSDSSVPESPAELTANIQLSLCPNCRQPVVPNGRFCSSCGTPLATGDTTALHGCRRDRTAAARGPRSVPGAAPGEAVLMIHRGPERGPVSNSRNLVTLGQGAESTIFLDDVTVSRRHAEVARGTAGMDPVRRREPQRFLREQEADRRPRPGNRRRGPDRKVPFRLPAGAGRMSADGRRAWLDHDRRGAETGQPGLPGHVHLQDPVPRDRRAHRTAASQVRIPPLHRRRCRSVASGAHRPARPVPATQGHRGAPGRRHLRDAVEPRPVVEVQAWEPAPSREVHDQPRLPVRGSRDNRAAHDGDRSDRPLHARRDHRASAACPPSSWRTGQGRCHRARPDGPADRCRPADLPRLRRPRRVRGQISGTCGRPRTPRRGSRT